MVVPPKKGAGKVQDTIKRKLGVELKIPRKGKHFPFSTKTIKKRNCAESTEKNARKGTGRRRRLEKGWSQRLLEFGKLNFLSRRRQKKRKIDEDGNLLCDA